MKLSAHIIIFVFCYILLMANPAHAYIAPLLGAAGVVATLVVILGSLFMSFFYIFWGHIKKLFGIKDKKKNKKDKKEKDDS